MKEKLVIKNFGPIKSVELELGRFNVLIGEQATGKSTVAKVLAVCRNFKYIIVPQEIDYQAADEFKDSLTESGLTDSLTLNTSIYYENVNYSLEIKSVIVNNNIYNSIDEYSQIGLWVELKDRSDLFKGLLSAINKLKYTPNQLDEFNKLIGSRIADDFLELEKIVDKPFYIPTERGLQSIFSLGKNSIKNISDLLFNQFAELDQIARLFRKDTVIEPLNITYKNDNGHGFVKKNNEEKFYSLYNAASGYQSTIPIVLVIKYFNEIVKKEKTFIIEEPELNLFPIAQNKLMQYLVDKTMNYGNSILMTTHSPYILSSINELMYAGVVGKDHPEEVSKIIDKKYWLDAEEVSVYRLMSDGTAKNIIDPDLKQIDVGELDEISRSINEVWDKIADIAYGERNEA